MGKLTNLNPFKPLTEADMPPGMATDIEAQQVRIAHEEADDPHPQYVLHSEGNALYRQVGVQQIFTPTVKSVGRSTGGIATPSGTTANQCGNEVQASSGSSAAYMSFHRPGLWGIHFGLDTNNQLSVGGWSLGNNSYKVFHEGLSPLIKAPLPSAALGGNSLAFGWNSVSPGLGIAELCNYSGNGGGDAFNFFRIPGNPDTTPTLSNRVSKIENTGAYVQTSDERVKSDVRPAPGLQILMKLSPVHYNHWNCIGFDNKNKTPILGEIFKEKIGFLAQEVSRHLPQAVSEPTSEDELYGLDYNCILACAVRAIQEQQEQITELRAQLQAISK
jgi:hypothetical protein